MRLLITFFAFLLSVALYGQNDYSMSFDGDDDYIDVGSGGLGSAPNVLTQEAWIKTTITGNYIDVIMTKRHDGWGPDWVTLGVNGNTGHAVFGFDGDHYWDGIDSSINVADNNWHYIVGTKNGNTINLYVDGDFQGTKTASHPFGSSYNLHIGHSGAWDQISQGNHFNGKIGEVRTWDIELTLSDIQQYMNCPPSGNEEGLVGYWNFEEGSGTTVFDQTENGNDGTINGATYNTDVPEQNCQSGCTDALANNFNPEATLDDGTCECNNQSIDLYLCHCAGGGYLNEWIRLTTPDGITEEYCDGGCSAGNWSPVNHAPELQCQNMANTIQASSNYFNAQCIENNTVRFVLRENSLGLSTIETSYCGENCGIWSINDEVNPQGEYSFSCYYDAGCMDSYACNYNPDATEDDGSCDYSCCPGPGCCLDGTVWSDELEGCVVETPTDSNLDGCTDLNDLMDLLGAYGICAFAEFTCGDLVSHDGYDYSTVQIGDQCWFAENCRYLPEVSPSSEGSVTEPYYYVYDYQGTDVEAAQATTNYATYGVLYNWPAVMTEGICPSGWHIPTDLEWQTMEIALGMSASEASSTEWRGTDEGHKMKSTSGWNNGGNGTNLSGFTGLSGGYTGSNNFFNNGLYGFWWSAAESGSSSWNRRLDGSSAKVFRANYDLNRQYGFSARCVRD